MEQITISLVEVSTTAGTIRRINAELMQELSEMKRIMNELSAYWQSPAAETIFSRFQGMDTIFENYLEIVEHYAQFLDTTVSSYESTEQRINQNAAAFA